MEFLFTGGKIGELFTSLAFASALVAMISLFIADTKQGLEKQSWERLGLGSFALHGLSIIGIAATIFYLIFTRQYQYHFVWDHASNELPVYYIISCFWEGQEGSFLLWCFWHSVLGSIFMFSGSSWRNMVLAILSSIELILSSMILGIYVGDSWVTGIYVALGIIPMAYFIYRYATQQDAPALKQNFRLASIFMGAGSLLLVLRNQEGFYDPWSLSQVVGSVHGAIFGAFLLASLAYVVYFGRFLHDAGRRTPYPVADVGAALSLIALALVAVAFETVQWKIGSSPFVLLKDVFSNNPIYQTQPDFVPTNGSGLNPLLQNYWMVIHPPTLFLGFASTAIPFAFVIAGLIKGNYKEWIRPAMPWTTFSIMVLGVGIIMGGYWAYETLNFGGYWNWDPVENSSLVPWLCGVAALHTMLIYQKTKAYLRLTMIMIISTFLLVLYSTFLTRSGILGDTSVHTFTDLGLSGQLLVLVFVYLVGVIVLFALRWRSIPQREDESKVWSAEFMLFLGVLTFVFAGLEIIFTTSLPVVNKILGTHIAPPPNIQLFYYQWNVWFAIAFGVLSALGQFLWWRKGKNKSISDALFRPFMIAIVSSCIVIIALVYAEMPFVYDSTFAEILEDAEGKGFLVQAMAYLEFGLIAIADELLLFAAIFSIAANTDVLISLLRKNKKGLKVMGGTVVHIGFALMLLGMLFSSGYDEVISKNLRPAELAGFPEDEKVDNVMLLRNDTRQIMGYSVTYLGKKQAKPPVSDLIIIEENEEAFKLKFKDRTGDWFGTVLPRAVFLEGRQQEESTSPSSEQHAQPTANLPASERPDGTIDLSAVETFLNEKVELLKPGLLNNRSKFAVAFESMRNPRDTFQLDLEVEINEDMGTTVTHPSRRIYLDRDVYVYASYAPSSEEVEPEYDYHEFNMKLGERAQMGNITLLLDQIKNLTDKEGLEEFDIAAAAHIFAFANGDTFFANPIYTIKDRTPGMVPATIDPLYMELAFVRVDPQSGTMTIQVRRQTNPQEDVIVIKAIQKPLINLLWLGTFVLVAGFGISIYRRIQESRRVKT